MDNQKYLLKPSNDNFALSLSRRASATAQRMLEDVANLNMSSFYDYDLIYPPSAAALASAATSSPGSTGTTGDRGVWVHGGHPTPSATTPTSSGNTSWEGGDATGDSDDTSGFVSVPHVLKSMVLVLIILLAIFSNLLVVLSVVRYHKLRHINNYFLVSLAVADLLVACFAMTFNATVEITGKWNFGYRICDLWNSLDVHFSTVSTLHLCCISVDRYYAIVRPLKYTSYMTVKVASLMIGVAWTAPTLISFLPIFLGWYTTQEHQEWRITHTDECIFRVNKPYALLSSTLTFWAPVVVMLVMYHRIYKEALRQKEAIRRSSVPSQQHLIVDSDSVRSHFAALQANGFKSTARKGIAHLFKPIRSPGRDKGAGNNTTAGTAATGAGASSTNAPATSKPPDIAIDRAPCQGQQQQQPNEDKSSECETAFINDGDETAVATVNSPNTTRASSLAGPATGSIGGGAGGGGRDSSASNSLTLPGLGKNRRVSMANSTTSEEQGQIPLRPVRASKSLSNVAELRHKYESCDNDVNDDDEGCSDGGKEDMDKSLMVAKKTRMRSPAVVNSCSTTALPTSSTLSGRGVAGTTAPSTPFVGGPGGAPLPEGATTVMGVWTLGLGLLGDKPTKQQPSPEEKQLLVEEEEEDEGEEDADSIAKCPANSHDDGWSTAETLLVPPTPKIKITEASPPRELEPPERSSSFSSKALSLFQRKRRSKNKDQDEAMALHTYGQYDTSSSGRGDGGNNGDGVNNSLLCNYPHLLPIPPIKSTFEQKWLQAEDQGRGRGFSMQRSPSAIGELGAQTAQWLRERHRMHTSWRKEHKAFVTLGIVMGAFLLCWLPFFSWYLTVTICGEEACPCPDIVVSILFWIGYFNSTLNPVIYVMTNRDFKDAFTDILRKIFCWCCKNDDDDFYGPGGAGGASGTKSFGVSSNVDYV